MGPRAAKRARVDHSEDRQEEQEDASHLVSFLTGYDHQREDGGLSDEAGEDGRSEEDDRYEEDIDNDDDGDDEEVTTPSRRLNGLLDSPSEKGKSSPSRATPKKRTPRKKAISTPSKLDKEGDIGFIKSSKADEYFYTHSKASRTSGNSYSALVKPLTQADYEKYANNARSKGKSKGIVSGLIEDLTRRFDQWVLELDEGFNLLFYGYGSKRRLINRFVVGKLSKKGHCVVINGHYPGLGIRDILSQIEDQLAVPQDIPVPSSAITPLEKAAQRIYAHFLDPASLPTAKTKRFPVSDVPLYLIIHNIDSASLRSPKSLNILSFLALCPKIRLIASFDHLHTPLLFSATATNAARHSYSSSSSWLGNPDSSRGFNWLYHNATTHDDYDVELSYQRLSASSTIAGISGGSAQGGISEEGALQILRSVPPMALRLLKLLLTKQISALPSQASSHVAYQANQIAPSWGIDNDILQKLAREKFIAREEERYNALMGEFKDHGLIVEAALDGEGRQGRWVWVPLGKAAMERVVQEISGVEA